MIVARPPACPSVKKGIGAILGMGKEEDKGKERWREREKEREREGGGMEGDRVRVHIGHLI